MRDKFLCIKTCNRSAFETAENRNEPLCDLGLSHENVKKSLV